ncbi:MAG: acyltransferase family protein, partial [Sedimentisphaerales bacterium]|nr:acyltransferase family protein [Sedimentisphaerales bacterium]
MAQRRLLYIDNLRIVAITLVIMVHLSITYGGAGGWYLIGKADPLSSAILTLFNASCQSFFMGLLFFLSGYFTPGSYDRKGAWPFLKDRLLRLGIPMLCYDFVVHPLLVYLLIAAGIYSHEGTFGDYMLSYYRGFHIGRGPLWFVEALLLFALVYAFWRWIFPVRTGEAPARFRIVTHRQLIALAVVLGTITFFVRLWRPMGWAFEPLN